MLSPISRGGVEELSACSQASVSGDAAWPEVFIQNPVGLEEQLRAAQDRSLSRLRLVSGENEVLKLIIERASLPTILEAQTRVAERHGTPGTRRKTIAEVKNASFRSQRNAHNRPRIILRTECTHHAVVSIEATRRVCDAGHANSPRPRHRASTSRSSERSYGNRELEVTVPGSGRVLAFASGARGRRRDAV
jgi:hypothetical protein